MAWLPFCALNFVVAGARFVIGRLLYLAAERHRCVKDGAIGIALTSKNGTQYSTGNSTLIQSAVMRLALEVNAGISSRAGAG